MIIQIVKKSVTGGTFVRSIINLQKIYHQIPDDSSTIHIHLSLKSYQKTCGTKKYISPILYCSLGIKSGPQTNCLSTPVLYNQFTISYHNPTVCEVQCTHENRALGEGEYLEPDKKSNRLAQAIWAILHLSNLKTEEKTIFNVLVPNNICPSCRSTNLP